MENPTMQLNMQVKDLLNQKKFNEVIALLTNEILQQNNDAGLYAEKANAYYALYDDEAALALATKAIGVNPDIALPYFIRGNIYLNEKKDEEAMVDYSKVIQLDPGYTDAYINRGLLEYYKRNYDKAIEDYSKAIQLNPNSTIAFYDRGLSWFYKGENNKAIDDFTQAILLDTNYAKAYYYRGLALNNNGLYDKSIEDFTKAIALKKDDSPAYIGRGNAWLEKGDYDKAIDDYNEAIYYNLNNADAFYDRGLAYTGKKEYAKAIEDFNNAITLNKEFANAFLGRGNVWLDIGHYDKAMEDYSYVIKLNERYDIAYFNRGLLWATKKEYQNAINDYNITILLNPGYLNAYYNRAVAYNALQEYEKSLDDYKKYLDLLKNADKYWVEVAQSAIHELEKILSNEWYKETAKLVSSIKTLLLFREKCVTHYTGLSATKAMVLMKSKFRLSEGAFLNDTSEGREIFKYLQFSAIKERNDKTLAEPFSEKPFIGSFVTEAKHDDLTLWRMYAKEDKIEARGCALTIDKDFFLSSLKNSINTATISAATASLAEEQFTFYKVAYMTNDNAPVFIVPGDDAKTDALTKLMRGLKEVMEKMPEEQKLNAKELLNGIAYLFKSVEYRYENEIRLIVQGVGFEKIINKDSAPPRVFIELVQITDALTKLTLGPKVERADEWAAAFNYQVKKDNSNSNVGIIISHLPFK